MQYAGNAAWLEVMVHLARPSRLYGLTHLVQCWQYPHGCTSPLPHPEQPLHFLNLADAPTPGEPSSGPRDSWAAFAFGDSSSVPCVEPGLGLAAAVGLSHVVSWVKLL